MKIPKIVFLMLLVLIPAVIAAGIFFFRSKPEPEQVFRANLTEAQKVLVTLRRAESAFQESSQSYKDISAKKIDGEMVYSTGWKEMKLPDVEAGTGFDYECLSAGGVCQALETAKTGPTGSGIRINIETGTYDCLGAYKPVTTEGFDGTLVTVACQA